MSTEKYILKKSRTNRSGEKVTTYYKLTKTMITHSHSLPDLVKDARTFKRRTSLTIDDYTRLGYEILHTYTTRITEKMIRDLFPEEFI